MSELGNSSLIVRVGFAEDIGDLLILGIDAFREEVRGVRAAFERTFSGSVIDVVSDGVEGLIASEVDVAVDEVRQLASSAAHVGEGQCGLVAEVLLKCQLGLMNLRVLKMRVEVYSVGRNRKHRRAAEDIWKWWCAEIGGAV